MSFPLKSITGFEMYVKFLPQVSADDTSEVLLEAIKASRVGDFLELELDSFYYLSGLRMIKRIAEKMPLVQARKGVWSFGLTPEGFNLELSLEHLEKSKSQGKTPITKTVLREGTEIVRRVLLWLAGELKKTEIETRFEVKFTIEPKVENLDHMIDRKRVESAAKLGCQLGQKTGRYSLSVVEDEIEAKYEILVIFPREEHSRVRRTDQVEYRTEVTRQGSLDDLDLSEELDRISIMTKKASLILGV